jgi:hypothetical protein
VCDNHRRFISRRVRCYLRGVTVCCGFALPGVLPGVATAGFVGGFDPAAAAGFAADPGAAAVPFAGFGFGDDTAAAAAAAGFTAFTADAAAAGGAASF